MVGDLLVGLAQGQDPGLVEESPCHGDAGGPAFGVEPVGQAEAGEPRQVGEPHVLAEAGGQVGVDPGHEAAMSSMSSERSRLA